MDKTQRVLELFCKTSGAKVNWNKSAAMWANRKRKEWDWSQEVGLQWIPEGKGMRYLGIQVGFHLPTEANFDKMMVALKNKFINWNTYCLSLAGKVLVSN